MDIRITHGPAFSMAVVGLQDGEQFVSENGAMVSMTSNVSVQTSSKAIGGKGGILSGLKRMLGGESFFNNVFTASGGPGEISLAPSLVGDIARHDLEGGAVIVQSSSWLGSGPGVELQTKWGGLKTFFGGEGLLMLRMEGTGPVLFNAFGGIHLMELDSEFIIDTGHIVAFEETLSFEVKRVGGWYSTFLSGEGLVCKFSGKGKLWIQTRNPNEFGRLVGSKLPPREQ